MTVIIISRNLGKNKGVRKMLFEGAYPPGVTGRMIDALEGDGRCCANCRYFNGDYCTREWNNAEEDYMVPERDMKDDGDCCDEYESEDEYDVGI